MDYKQTVIGIELGSTRIKAVMLDKDHRPVASGNFEWENQLRDGIWTYDLDDAKKGLQICFAALKKDAEEKFGKPLTTTGAIGISGMMHGYIATDKNEELLVPFRTWRNTMTGEAAEKLTELFGFAIPQRWSIAHLYQAILSKEPHVKDIAHLTTLAGYISWLLTGERVMGIGEASGMFPIDSENLDYDRTMVEKFDALEEVRAFDWKLLDLLPKVLCAGTQAGSLTKEGALLLDSTGMLEPGIPLAPCEGDGGTGMTATNSVRMATGNVSAGTSDFAMVVVEKPLGHRREINMVTTPSGKPVAMVHCSNCTSDINAWVNLFGEFAKAIGADISKGDLFTLLFRKALEGKPDCGGLLSYNYYSGEGITKVNEGRPVFLRTPDASMDLGDFMRTHLYSAMATLKIGLDILIKEENVKVDRIYGHGGYFKTPGVGQRILSAAANAPVSVMETAGEGGPYGMALLSAYMIWKEEGEALEDYLDGKVFADAGSETLMASPEEVAGFDAFLEKYVKAFPVEKTAVETLR